MRIGSAGWLVVSGTLSGVLGCGDPLPPPARLAVRLELSGCGVDNQYSLPEDPTVAGTLQEGIPQSQLDQLPRLVEGEDSTTPTGTFTASVSCSVVDNGNNQFSFSASASLGSARRFTLSNGTTAGGPNGTGTARVSFLHPNTIPQRSANNCAIRTELAPAGGGAMLLSFDCRPPNSTFSAENINTPNCQATGTVVIDRCSK